MITFTVPQQIRRFIRSHQRLCYAAMFRASADTMKKLATDPKYIGGDLSGFFVKVPETEIKPMNPPTCSICGGNLIYRGSILVFQSSLPAGAG